MRVSAQIEATIRDIRERQKRVVARLAQVPAIQLSVRTARGMGAHDASHMAAGVAYYAVLSLFPLILGLIAIMGLFLDSERLQERLFEFVRTYLPASTDFVERNVQNIIRVRGALGLLSVLGLFWSGSALFGAVGRALNRAWDIPYDRPFYIAKARQLSMALGSGLLFILSMAGTTLVQVVASLDIPFLSGLSFLRNAAVLVGTWLLAFLSTLAVFLVIYKYLPNTQTRWRQVWPGAVLAAALFEVAKALFVLYLNSFANYQQVYGSLASVIVLMVWAYISALILILGAEFASQYWRMRQEAQDSTPGEQR